MGAGRRRCHLLRRRSRRAAAVAAAPRAPAGAAGAWAASVSRHRDGWRARQAAGGAASGRGVALGSRRPDRDDDGQPARRLLAGRRAAHRRQARAVADRGPRPGPVLGVDGGGLRGAGGAGASPSPRRRAGAGDRCRQRDGGEGARGGGDRSKARARTAGAAREEPGDGAGIAACDRAAAGTRDSTRGRVRIRTPATRGRGAGRPPRGGAAPRRGSRPGHAVEGGAAERRRPAGQDSRRRGRGRHDAGRGARCSRGGRRWIPRRPRRRSRRQRGRRGAADSRAPRALPWNEGLGERLHRRLLVRKRQPFRGAARARPRPGGRARRPAHRSGPPEHPARRLHEQAARRRHRRGGRESLAAGPLSRRPVEPRRRQLPRRAGDPALVLERTAGHPGLRRRLVGGLRAGARRRRHAGGGRPADPGQPAAERTGRLAAAVAGRDPCRRHRDPGAARAAALRRLHRHRLGRQPRRRSCALLRSRSRSRSTGCCCWRHCSAACWAA